MQTSTLLRDTPATVIPAGDKMVLPAGLNVFITQSLGGNVTVRTEQGLFQIAREHASAIKDFVVGETAPAAPVGEFSEEAVWAALRTCFDPEIPVNIVDLGLIYDIKVSPENEVHVTMTLTTPGCGMAQQIALSAKQRVLQMPGVAQAWVTVVWEPKWDPSRMSPAARSRLGLPA